MNKWIRGTNATVLSLAVIGIFIVVTIMLSSLKGLQWDLTKDKKFTLSEQTLNLIKKVDKDIKVTVFSGGQADPYLSRQVSDLLKEYENRSNKITLTEYNMTREPSIARQYNVDPGGTVVFESGDQKKSISFYQMFIPTQTSYFFTGEEKFTQAIMNITSSEQFPVYFLSGHGEIPFNELNVLRSNLEGVNFIVKELNLLREGKIPDDAHALFIVGAQNDLSDQETELIKTYLKGNGKLFLALGFNKDMATSWKNIDEISGMLGVIDQHAVALEQNQTTLLDPRTIVPEYGFHTIVNKLEDANLLTVISLAIGLATDNDVTDYQPQMLLRTTNRAFGETDIESLMQGKPSPGVDDVKGPLNLAYAVTNSGGTPKAVIIGGFSFLTDSGIMFQGNRDFALNSVSWLQEQEDQVTIRPREGDTFQEVIILPKQGQRIFYGTVIVFPLFFLLVGGFIWSRRRKG